MGAGGLPDLRTFLDDLRRAGDLRTVEVPVDADQEVAEIHRRVIAAGGPALLFRSVGESSIPVATNLFGTAARAAMAFGDEPFEVMRSLVGLAEELLPPTLPRLWGARTVGRKLLRVGMRRRRSGAVREVIEPEVDLSALPALTTWPEDGGPFLTLGQVYTEHPDTGGHNLGLYRLQVHDETTLGMHWQIGKGGGFHHDVAERRGEALPVTVSFGGPPATILSAIAPLPENVPELLLASLLLGGKLPVCTGPAGHPVPADAEIMLHGSVPPAVRRPEGPFGDHYGYYSLTHDYPVLEVDTVWRRKDAILPATVVGKPRQEDFFIGDLLQELLSPLFPLVMPGVVDLWSYGETGYHSLAGAVVRERYKREAMASAFRLLGEGQLSLTKFLLVTDRPVDLKDFPATLAHVLERTRPETDLFVFANLSMDTLDYTGPAVNEGSKGVWLGLGEPVRTLPRELVSTEVPAGVAAARVFCPGCLVLDGSSKGEDPGLPTRVARHAGFADWPLIVLTDDAVRATASPMNFLWTTFTRFEPAADIHAAETVLDRNHVGYRGPVVIDARLAPGFPAELFCEEDVARRVSARWSEYFPDGDVEMGDSDGGHLA